MADGEVDESWSEFLDAVTMERDEKALGIARYVKKLEAEAEAVKAEKQKLAKRQATLDNRVESLKSYLSVYIRQGEKISDANTVISWRKSSAVKVVDESAIPEAYWKIERTLKRAEIKADCKAEAIPGVEILEKHSIQIK